MMTIYLAAAIDQRVDRNGADDDGSLDEPLIERRDVQEVETVDHDADDEDAGNRAEQRAAAAAQTRAADDRRGDRGQLVAFTVGRDTGGRASRQNDTAQTGEQPRQRIDRELDHPRVDTRHARGFFVSADGVSLEGDLESLGRDIIALGRRYVSHVGDVTNPDDISTIVAAAGATFGGVDILVNNAGVAIIEPALETTLANWNKTLAINLTGAFLCAQAVAPQMIERKFGRIINLSSQASLIALPGHVAYTASKCGINAITHVLALEWGKFGITTNAVAPTVVNTELGKAVWSDPAKGDPMRAMIPVGRFAEPIEVAQAALYLGTDAAAMVNGHILCIDGGATIH